MLVPAKKQSVNEVWCLKIDNTVEPRTNFPFSWLQFRWNLPRKLVFPSNSNCFSFTFRVQVTMQGSTVSFDRVIGGSGLSQSHFSIELDVTKTGRGERKNEKWEQNLAYTSALLVTSFPILCFVFVFHFPVSLAFLWFPVLVTSVSNWARFLKGRLALIRD